VLANGAAGAAQFGILFVCTGNACRSVLAERLAWRGLRARLGADAGLFRVASAGTASLDGGPIHPYTAEALTWLGADTEGFASHRLTPAGVAAADLILTACQEHRDQVVAMAPGASRRAYLMREFVRVAAFAVGSAESLSAVEQARQLVAEVARLRGRVPYVEPAEDEIADPIATPAAFLDCARGIDAIVSRALDALCPRLSGAQRRGQSAR
jgi:protein-tyrosine phosphatase